MDRDRLAKLFGDAWLRREPSALDHLFDYCNVPSVAIPAPRLDDNGHDGNVAADPNANSVSQVSAVALESIRSQLAAGAVPDLADGVLAVGLYFQSLLAWEATDDFARIGEFVDAAGRALTDLVPHSDLRSVAAARRMLESIPKQCTTEEARLCACSYSLQLAAGDVVTHLSGLAADAVPDDSADSFLLNVVNRDIRNARAFYSVLADHVGPCAVQFPTALIDTSSPLNGSGLSVKRAELLSEIQRAVPHVESAARGIDAGEVLGGELAAHGDALVRMAEALHVDSLVLDRGRLIYVYPFTVARLDPDEPGISVLGERYELDLDGHDIPFRFQQTHRTDAWQFRDDQPKFADRGELVLDGYELRFRPKWVEYAEERRLNADGELVREVEPDTQFHAFEPRVVLGEHGGNYLHLETQVGVGTDTDEADPWTGAHVDQWVRRLNKDAGADRVSLHRTDDPAPVATWETLHAFAVAVASAVDKRDNVREPDEGDERQPGLVGESVIFQVQAGRVIEPNGSSRPLRAGDKVECMTGYSALMATARYLPASVEEWIRLEAPPRVNLLDQLRPFGDTLLVNEDVIALFSLGSPNWVVMEQLEMLEFAISLHGFLEHLSIDLQQRLQHDEDGERIDIAAVTGDIRRGNQALELLRSRDLMRSRYHSELLTRILHATGAGGLDARLENTVQSLRDVRAELEEEARRMHSAQLGLTVFVLTLVTGFIGIYGFIRAFFPDHVGAWSELLISLFSFGVTGAVATAYVVIHRRHSVGE